MPAKGVLPVITTTDVAVVGGGVIGTAIAWRAAAAGLGVAVVDPGRGDAATEVAAGMLAPESESSFGEDALLALTLLASKRFPGFAAELEEVTGDEVGLRREGTLAVAYDSDDLAALRRLSQFRRSVGLTAEELDGRACRQLEPFLAPDVCGGVLFAGDGSVDNRRYAAALRKAARMAGVTAVRGRATQVRTSGGRVCGVQCVPSDGPGDLTVLGDGSQTGPGGEIGCGAVVIAAGCWSGEVAGLPAPVAEAIRPVKGQLLRLRVPAGLPPVLTHTVRGAVRGEDVYLVPRTDGEVVVGATSEERGPDRSVTAGAVHDLLRRALSLLPVTSELLLAETCAGLRPGTIDNGPVLGAAGPAGLLVATGHYRNGILLSAVTADAAVACLTGRRPAPEWQPFTPGRFPAGVGSR